VRVTGQQQGSEFWSLITIGDSLRIAHVLKLSNLRQRLIDRPKTGEFFTARSVSFEVERLSHEVDSGGENTVIYHNPKR
jgi:hypothetical protein